MEGVELAPSKSAYLVNQDNEAATKEVQEEVDLTKNLALLRRRRTRNKSFSMESRASKFESIYTMLKEKEATKTAEETVSLDKKSPIVSFSTQLTLEDIYKILNRIRRLYRIVLMVVFCSLTILAPVISMTSDFSATTHLVVTKSDYNSTIRFVDSSLKLSILEPLINNNNNNPENNNKKGFHFTTDVHQGLGSCKVTYEKRTNELIVPVFTNCQVSGLVPSNFTLPSHTIELHSTSVQPSTMKFVRNTSSSSQNSTLFVDNFVVEGNYAEISMRGIQVQNQGKLEVHLSGGDISIVDVSLGDNANLNVRSDAGNVLLLLRTPAYLQYHQNENGGSCLSAPELNILSSSCQITNENVSSWNDNGADTSNISLASKACRGTAVMRPENATLRVDKEDYKHFQNLPTVNASSTAGSLYVAMLPQGPVQIQKTSEPTDDLANTTKITVARGPGMPGKSASSRVELGPNKYIQNIGTDAKQDPSSIIYAVFPQTFGTSPYTSERMVYTSRDTFLNIKPWMLTMFSGSLLGPNVVTAQLRWEVPLPCPLSFHDGTQVYNDNTPMVTEQDTIILMEELRKDMDTITERPIPGIVAKISSTADGEKTFGPTPESLKIIKYNINGAAKLVPFTLVGSVVHLVLLIISILVATIASFVVSSVIVSELASTIDNYFVKLRRTTYMKQLKNVVRSNPYKEPKYKEMYVKKLEEAAAKKAKKAEASGSDSDSSGSDSDSDDEDGDMESINGGTADGVQFPFAIPAILNDINSKKKGNSLPMFLQIMSRPCTSDGDMMKSLVPLRDFKELYHSYCFDQQLLPKTLEGRLKQMEKFGLSIKTVYDHRTDAFINIRLVNPKEKRERLDMNPFPRETTLSYFVRTQCVISPFDVDYCTFRDFSQAYETFNRQNAKIKRCRPVPVTKREMLRMSIKSKRLQLKFVRSKPFETDVGDSQVQLVRDSKSSDFIEDSNTSSSGLMVLFWDLVMVFGHVFLITIANAPLIILPIFSEALSGITSSKATPYQLSLTDLTLWNYATYEKLIYLRMEYHHLIIVAIGLLCMLLQFIELTLFYTFQPFKLNQLHGRISVFRKVLLRCVAVSFSLCLHVWIGYIALILVWMILGAVIDPYKYLSHAAAAGVLVSFASTNAASASQAHSKIFNAMKFATLMRFTKAANDMLPLLSKGRGNNLGEQNDNKIETRALELVERDTFLRKVLRRCKGIDLPIALGLARGSESAAMTASESLGMNKNVLSCIAAVARLDHRGVLKAIEELGINDTFGEGANADLLTRIYRLAQRQNEESLRLAVKDILTHSSVNVNEVSPHRLESIIAIGRGQVGRIVNVVKTDAIARRENKEGDNTYKQTRIDVISAFIDIIRNDSSDFEELNFTKEWVNLLGAVTELSTNERNGIGYLKNGLVRQKEALEILADNHFDLAKPRGNDKQKGKDLTSLLIGIARDSHDEVRLYGPGSEQFSTLVFNATGVVLIPEQLQGLLAISRGCLIDVERLAKAVGVKLGVGVSVAHLIAEPDGFGNVFIGLAVKKGKKNAASAAHLTWISKCIGIQPAVYLGMTCIARGNVSDHRATKAVNACIKWFTDKLPTDLHEDELNDIVGNFIDIFSSKNAETVKKACDLMLRRKMNSMVTVKEAKQRDINQEHDEKMLDDAEDSKAGSHAKVHPARFKRPGFKSLKNRVYKNKLSLNSSVIGIIEDPINYCECILFARGLVDPFSWLKRAQEKEFGEALKLKGSDIRKLTAKIAILFQVSDPLRNASPDQDPVFLFEKDPDKHDDLVYSWKNEHKKRLNILKEFKKILAKESKLRREKLDASKKQHKKKEKNKNSFLGDLLMMETSFPKKFHNFLEKEGLSKEQCKKVAAFVQLSTFSTLKLPVKATVQGSFAALMGLPTELIKNILNIFHGQDEFSKEDPSKHIKIGAEIRLEAVMNLAKFAFEDNQELPEQIKQFGMNIILYQAAANKTHSSVDRTSDYLNQPRFMFHVISRDHEPGFGASASGAADIPLQNSIVDFVKELKLGDARTVPTILKLSDDAVEDDTLRRELLLCGIGGLVCQDAQKVKAFQDILGLSKQSETLEIACQLFGNVGTMEMVNNVESLMEKLETLSDKKLRFLPTSGITSFEIEKDTWFQPNPLSRSFQLWNLILMLLIAWVIISLPLELLSILEWEAGAIFEVICELLFVFDMIISFYTPFWLPKRNKFEVKFTNIADNYLSSFFFTDLIASIPVNTIVLLTTASNSNNTVVVLSFLKPLKFLRSLRVLRLFKTVQRILRFKKAMNTNVGYGGQFGCIDYAKSLVVLAAEKNIKITTSVHPNLAMDYPTDILAAAVPHFSSACLRGLIAVHEDNQAGVKEQLIQMVEDGFLPLPESVVRGLISLATGEVDSIEDVASALKFDPDVAEGLAFVASSFTIDVDHAALGSSSSLNKLCQKLGVEQSVVAALLAIVNQDYEASEEINAQLTLVDINDQFLSAVMAVYSDDINHDPDHKTDAVEEFLGPVSRLYCPTLSAPIVAGLVRLVQGDATTIQRAIGSKMGWSKSERNIVTSLVLCSQRTFGVGESKTYMQSKRLDFSPSESQNWAETRDAGKCSGIIASVLQLRKEAVKLFVFASHGDVESLQRLQKLLEGGDLGDEEQLHEAEQKAEQKQTSGKGKKKVWTLNKVVEWLKELGGLAPNINMGYSHLNKLAANDDDAISTASSQASQASMLESGINNPSRDAAKELKRSAIGNLKLMKVIQKLNDRLTDAQKQEVDQEGEIHKIKKLAPEVVQWIIRLCHGDIKWNGWHHLAKFVREARCREREKQGTPAIWFRGVAEIVTIACGIEWYSMRKDEDGVVWDEDEEYFLIQNPSHFNDDELGLNNPFDIYPGPLWPIRKKKKSRPEISATANDQEQDLSGFSEDEDVTDDEDEEDSFDIDISDVYGSMLNDLGFTDTKEIGLGVTFVIKLGFGNAEVWNLANGDGVISSKILADTRIIAAFSGLAAQDLQTINLNLRPLCSLIGTDIDACGSLIRIAMGDYSRLNVEIDKICKRTGARVTKDIALGFCAGCTLVPEQISALLAPLCSELDLDPKGNGDGITIAASIVLAAQCKGDISREAWRVLVETSIKMRGKSTSDIDSAAAVAETTQTTTEWLRKNPPCLWICNAICAMLSHDARKVKFYGPKLDAYFGIEKVWTELVKQTQIKGANPTGIGIHDEDYVDNAYINEEADDEDSALPSCTSLLYAIATNDMDKLDGLLKILAPIAVHPIAVHDDESELPKSGEAKKETKDLIKSAIEIEKKARNITLKLVKVFNRQASPLDLDTLENLFRRKTGFPKGAFTAIAASLDGDLDAFAHGIDEVTTTCVDPDSGEPFYTDVRGLPALLVSLVRSDSNADMAVFNKVLHLLGQPSPKKRNVPASKTEPVQSNTAVSRTRFGIPVALEDPKFISLINFIFGVCVGGKNGIGKVIEGCQIFGFNDHLAADLMALCGGGVQQYAGVIKEAPSTEDCFVLPQDLQLLENAMDGSQSFVVKSNVSKDADQDLFRTSGLTIKGKHITYKHEIPTNMRKGKICFVQRDNPYQIFETLTEILTIKFQKHILQVASADEITQSSNTMISMLDIVSSGYSALGRGRKGISVSLHNVAKHAKELVISKTPTTKKWWREKVSENGRRGQQSAGDVDFRKNPYRKPDDLDLLDGIFLSQADAPSHNEILVNCITTLLDLLNIISRPAPSNTNEDAPSNTNEDGNTNLAELLAGIMCLISPTDSQEAETRATAIAKQALAESLSDENTVLSPELVGFCMGLARMDMTLVEDMGKQVGEFDFDVVDDILTLISRLAPVIKSISSNETDGDDNNSKSSKSTDGQEIASNLENIDASSEDLAALSAEIMFHACVAKSGDTYMAFDEFKTACKVLNLNYHEQALYELFLLGDVYGTGLLTVSTFGQLLELMMLDVSARGMKIRGKSKFGTIVKVCLTVLTLLALIVFLLLGVMTFSLGGGFAAGASSGLFGAVGKLMDSLNTDEDEEESGEGEEEDEDEEGEGGETQANATDESSIEEAISVYSV